MRFVLFLILLLASGAVRSQSTLDADILEHMENKHVSGLAAVIISETGIEWEGYYGLANRQDSVPVTDSTIFMLASISKTITATALMQLWEDGAFDLDDPVNDHLPFTIINPDHPDTDITIRQLLTHTSSIEDNWDVMEALYVIGDSPIALSDFMEAYFTPGGAYYSAASNFYSAAPGSSFHYSNIGASMCGLLVETIAGIPFNEYCNEHIFDLLCMDHTAWFLSELNEDLVAHPYTYFIGNYNDEGLYGYPDYPDGQLRTTARSLAKFLHTSMTGGSFDGEILLEPATIDSMLTVQYPGIDNTQGLIWYNWNKSGTLLWGHNGGDAGVVTDMYFEETTHRGYVILTNGNASNQPVLDLLMDSEEEDWYADPIAMSCDMPVVVDDLSSSAPELSVQPNPADLFTRITTPPDLNARYRICDMQGHLVRSWEMVPSDGVISTGTLSAGTYLLQWSNGQKNAACVLVVQNR